MNETAKIIFGLVGGLAMFLFVFIIPLFAKFVQFISPKGNEVEVISRQIANALKLRRICLRSRWIR